MYEISCVLENLLPAFAGGASADQPAEVLRPPTLRGLLRFWWRTLHGDYDVATLAREEGRIFGDIRSHGEGYGQGLRIIPLGTQGAHVRAREAELARADVLGYGGLGVMERVSGRVLTTRACVMENTRARFRLVHRDAHALREVAEALWTLGAFGGYGSRSRRGFGSLQVVAWDDPDSAHARRIGPPRALPGDSTSPETLAAGLRSWRLGLPASSGLHPGSGSQRSLPLWTAWSPESVVRVYRQAATSPYDALAEAIADLKRFRGLLGIPHFKSSQYGPDHDLIYDFVGGIRAKHPPLRAGFGLPHNYRLTWRGTRTGKNDATAVTVASPTDRRASPVFFHVTRLGTPRHQGVRYVAIVAFLPAQFLPDDSALTLTVTKAGTQPGIRVNNTQVVQTDYSRVVRVPALSLGVNPASLSIYSAVRAYFDGCDVFVRVGGGTQVLHWGGLGPNTIAA